MLFSLFSFFYELIKYLRLIFAFIIREVIKEAFRELTGVSKISIHSLRAGGATSVANAGVLDQLFTRHGRWTREDAKNGYVKDNSNSFITVAIFRNLDNTFCILRPCPTGRESSFELRETCGRFYKAINQVHDDKHPTYC